MRVPAAAPSVRAILHAPTGAVALLAQGRHPAGPCDEIFPDPIEKLMPTALAATAHSPEQAVPLVLALLFDDRADVRGEQEACVRQFLGESALADATALASQVAQLDSMLRLPLAELAFPALRKRPRPELLSLIACADAMARIDGEVSLFVYCVGCMLHRQLSKSLDPSASWRAGRKKPLDVLDEIALLLSMIAHGGIVRNGEVSAVVAERAYAAGMHAILPDANIAYAPPTEGFGALDKAWIALDGLDGIGKTLLIEGMLATIGPAGKPTVAQSDLLRTACAVLDCPLPSMLDHMQP